MTSPGSRTDLDDGASGGRGVYPRAASLASLSGAHPDALRALYSAGRPTDPAEKKPKKR